MFKLLYLNESLSHEENSWGMLHSTNFSVKNTFLENNKTLVCLNENDRTIKTAKYGFLQFLTQKIVEETTFLIIRYKSDNGYRVFIKSKVNEILWVDNCQLARNQKVELSRKSVEITCGKLKLVLMVFLNIPENYLQLPVTQTTKLIKMLNAGRYANVYKGFYLPSKRFCAVKFMNKKGFEDLPKEVFENEIKFLNGIEHSYLMSILAIEQPLREKFVITTLAHGGTLLNVVERIGALDEVVVRHVFDKVLQAVVFLHDRNIVHRNIKLEHIYLMSNNAMGPIKLGSFSCCCFNYDKVQMCNPVGTFCYMAPEMLESCISGSKLPYDMNVDIWSFGVAFFACFFAKFPFEDIKNCHNLMREIKEENWKIILDEKAVISSGAKHTIKQCLQLDPENRLKIKKSLRLTAEL